MQEQDQAQQYFISEQALKQEVDSKHWQQIDKNLPQIPSGRQYYTICPKQNLIKYYRRFLYFLHNEEKEDELEHALAITGFILLAINTNNYYALLLRTQCRKKIWSLCKQKQQYIKLFNKQMHLAQCVLYKNPKQYQLWNYKKDLIEQISRFNPLLSVQEKDQIFKKQQRFLFFLMINDDEKNYHVWDYKAFIVRKLGCIQIGIKETEDMIFVSPKQNYDSVDQTISYETLWKNCYCCWSFRFNLIMDLPQDKKQKYLVQDSEKVHDFILKNPQSECGWNYLTGLLQVASFPKQTRTKIIAHIYEVCKLAGEQNKGQNRYAWSFLFQLAQNDVKKIALQKLQQIDPIRKLYYQYLRSNNLQIL